MVGQEVEQQTTEMWVLRGIVEVESRRQWTSMSMERRRMSTTPVKKEPGNYGRGKRSWVEVGDKNPVLSVKRILLHLLVPNEKPENLTDRIAKARHAQKLGNILVKSGILWEKEKRKR